MSSLTTKKAIASALKELLNDKPLTKVTINDIADKCAINRQTFYYHFADIIDLVERICLEDAEDVVKNKTTYDTWQEAFLSIFNVMKKDKVFIMNIYYSVPKEIITNYLYKMVYPLIYKIVEEKSKGLVVREEDKKFVADFFKYSFVAIVLKRVNDDMKEDPQNIIDHLSVLVQGTIEHALINYSSGYSN